jgi:hypothetical protein
VGVYSIFGGRHQMPDDISGFDWDSAIHIAKIVVGRRMDILRSELANNF